MCLESLFLIDKVYLESTVNGCFAENEVSKDQTKTWVGVLRHVIIVAFVCLLHQLGEFNSDNVVPLWGWAA